MHFEMKQDRTPTIGGIGGSRTSGQWHWNLHGDNGKIIATSGSEFYHNKAECLHAIRLVQGTTTDTPIREL